ncbi:MAG: formate/nitrite transporter family protein [Alphaproteobacteria bacterium]|nr:formate/nitrite transporter family protein [Alphaproteobacteria bacterium]
MTADIDHTEAGAGSPHLSEADKKKAHENATLPAEVIHEIVREDGERQLARSANAIWWSGLAAGLSMGFSFVTQAELQVALPDKPWRPLIANLGYTVGFAIVVLGRQQLFTESTLSAVLPALTRRTGGAVLACLRLWAIVLVANIVGTWIFAAVLAYGQPLSPEAAGALVDIGIDAVTRPFLTVLLSAVFAGWLIALMVWLLPSSSNIRLLVIVFLAYVVALGRFSHIIAGSTDAAYAFLTAHTSLGRYLIDFFVPTLIGNTIGGSLLVGLLNHAPVAPELEKSQSPSGGGR